MSFKFKWPQFSEDFYQLAKQQIGDSLNNIQNDVISAISVEDLYFGTEAPHIEILEITTLDMARFKGIMKIEYSGDAHIQLRATVQINPLQNMSESPLLTRAGVAQKGLEMPMSLHISQLKLDAVISIGYSMQQGLTVNFKNDPLHSITIRSTFDELGINDLITREIKERIRSSLRDVLPRILHQMSLKWDINKHTQSAPALPSLQVDTAYESTTVAVSPLRSPLLARKYLSPSIQSLAARRRDQAIRPYATSLPDLTPTAGHHRSRTQLSVKTTHPLRRKYHQDDSTR